MDIDADLDSVVRIPLRQKCFFMMGGRQFTRHDKSSTLQVGIRSGCRNVLAIALANKLAGIAWSVLAHGRNFEARKIHEAAA